MFPDYRWIRRLRDLPTPLLAGLLLAGGAAAAADEPPGEKQPPVCNPVGNDCDDATGLDEGCSDGGSDVGTDESGQYGQSDSIVIHSGRELRTEWDYASPGIDSATEIEFKRRHTSRRVYDGSDGWAGSTFGRAWSFNYQRRLEWSSSEPNVIREYGFDRVDRFERVYDQSAGSWTSRWVHSSGRKGVLVWNGQSGSSVRIWRQGGAQFLYGPVLNGVSRFETLVSPSGNTVGVSYATGGTAGTLGYHKIDSISDSYGRKITFEYSNSADLTVDRIVDFDGRIVEFKYGTDPTLLETRTNAEGGVTQYSYWDSSEPRIDGSLKSIVSPNQEASGEPYLEWDYYDSDDVGAGLVSGSFLGYVKSHTVGNVGVGSDLSAGGTYEYSYDSIYVQGANGPNDPSMRVTVESRRGDTALLNFNQSGQMIREEILETRRGGAQNGSIVTSYLFDTDGHVQEITRPLGDRVLVEYGTGLRGNEGNQTAVTLLPDAVRPSDQAQIRFETVFEPVFNREFRVTTPRGLEAGATASDFTTEYIYDYMEDLDTSIPILADCLGVTEAELTAALTAAGITTQTFPPGRDLNGDGLTDQRCGQKILVRHPHVALPSQSSLVPVNATQVATDVYQYNDLGQRIYHRDGEGNIDLWTYYPKTNPHGSPSGGASYANAGVGGYLRSLTEDAVNSSGRNSNNQAPANADETIYVYHTNYTTPQLYSRDRATGERDPRGVWNYFGYDALDRLKLIRAAAQVSPTATYPALDYFTEYDYDANGNMTEMRVEDAGGVNGPGVPIRYEREYDILNNERSRRNDAGGVKQTILRQYDANENLTRVERQVGSGKHSVTLMEFDNRDIVIKTTKGAGTQETSSEVNEIDLNGDYAVHIDGAPSTGAQNDRKTILRDGYGRVRQELRNDGTRVEFLYDAGANVVRRDVYGVVEALVDVAGSRAQTGELRLSSLFSKFDARGRRFQIDEELLHYPGLSNGEALDPGALATSVNNPHSANAEYSSTVVVFDRVGRAILRAEADGGVTRLSMDGRNRVVEATATEGTKTVNTFDGVGNVLTKTYVTKSTLAGGPSESFTQKCTYDAGSRRTSIADPNNQTTRYEYDSRNNFVRTIDALGNQIEAKYDGLSHRTQTTQFLAKGGVNASAQNLNNDPARGEGQDPKLGAFDGRIDKYQTWDEMGRLRTRTDDRGSETTYSYDHLHRLVRTDFGDGTFKSSRYNADGEKVLELDASGILSTFTYDANGRRLSQTSNPLSPNHGVDVVGSSKRMWSYDGLGRQWSSLDNNDADPANTANNVLISWRVDSMGRRIQEQMTIGGVTLPASKAVFSGRHRVKRFVYPSGRVIDRTFDDGDRIREIFDVSGASQMSLMQRDYVGRGRLVTQSYANGSVLDMRNGGTGDTLTGPNAGYDSAGRVKRLRWVATNQPGDPTIVNYSYAYNGAGGVGTNRLIRETRGHLGGAIDRYTHDSAYRMTGFKKHGHGWGFKRFDGAERVHVMYDAEAGQVIHPDTDGVPAEAGLNQYSDFDGALNYDANGARLGGVVAGDLALRSDHLGRVTRSGDVNSSGGIDVSHQYLFDAMGRRVAKLDTAGQPLRYFLYDLGWQVLEEFDGSLAPLRSYVFGDRGLDDHIQMRVFGTSGGDYYYHCNTTGFVGALTDSTGAVVEYYDYGMMGLASVLAPNGTNIGSASTVGNPYMFQGRRLDEESGLFYFRKRSYDPRTGDFTTLDPTGIWSHGNGTGYSAFNADPFNCTDPMGEHTLLQGALGAAVRFIAADLVIPDPSDLAPPKAIIYAGVGILAWVVGTDIVDDEPETEDPEPEPEDPAPDTPVDPQPDPFPIEFDDPWICVRGPQPTFPEYPGLVPDPNGPSIWDILAEDSGSESDGDPEDGGDPEPDDDTEGEPEPEYEDDDGHPPEPKKKSKKDYDKKTVGEQSEQLHEARRKAAGECKDQKQNKIEGTGKDKQNDKRDINDPTKIWPEEDQ